MTATISAPLTGIGGFTKDGLGTLILSGTNTYSGLTTVNAGILNIQNSSALGATTNGTTISSGATLQLQGGISVGTEALTISGSGAAGQNGALVNVSGTNNYGGLLSLEGDTTISSDAGTLNLTNTGTITGAGFGLTLAGAGDGTISSIIGTGTGTLTKSGAGTWTLFGENTYTGATTVNAGSLIIDGSIASAETFVNAGGLLGGGPAVAEPGRGIIGGNLTNGGIVSPGDSPGSVGTLTINGNYTQTAGGTLRIEIAGLGLTEHDLLVINGTANISGTLQFIRLNNFQLSPGDQITFLTANGGVNGTFNPIINPFAITGTIVAIQVVPLPNGFSLEAIQGSFGGLPGLTPNQKAVAKAVDSAVGDPRAATLISFLDHEPLSNLPSDFELIAPEELAAMFNIGVSLANIQSVNLERRMEDIRAGSSGFSARGFSIDGRVPESSSGLAGPTGPEGKNGPSVMQPTPENHWGVFVTGLGEFTSVDDTSIAPGYDFSTGGLTFGVDYRVSPNFAIGLTGGYAHTNANLVNNGNLDVNGGTIGAYATAFAGGLYVDAAALGVFNGYDERRTALLGAASGNTNGSDFNALLAAGYDWKKSALTVGPTVSYQYGNFAFNNFTEHGSLAPLSVNDQNANSSRTALGAKATYDWHAGNVLIRPEIRASWQHEFGDRDYSIASRFANGAGNAFTVTGPTIGRDSLLIGAGGAVLLNDRVSVYAYYDGELARTNYSSNNVSAGLRFTF